MVNAADAASITALCNQVERNKAVEMAVLIVNTTQPEDIDQYAVDVFAKNGIGKKGESNGLLMVIATTDRTWRVEVGYGLEPVLPDELRRFLNSLLIFRLGNAHSLGHIWLS